MHDIAYTIEYSRFVVKPEGVSNAFLMYFWLKPDGGQWKLGLEGGWRGGTRGELNPPTPRKNRALAYTQIYIYHNDNMRFTIWHPIVSIYSQCLNWEIMLGNARSPVWAKILRNTCVFPGNFLITVFPSTFPLTLTTEQISEQISLLFVASLLFNFQQVHWNRSVASAGEPRPLPQPHRSTLQRSCRLPPSG